MLTLVDFCHASFHNSLTTKLVNLIATKIQICFIVTNVTINALAPLLFHHGNTTYMANIPQEQPSIRNMQVVSSNRLQSTHSFEANKCRIFQSFFLFIR